MKDLTTLTGDIQANAQLIKNWRYASSFILAICRNIRQKLRIVKVECFLFVIRNYLLDGISL
jgi:hypothetical protein